MTEARLSFVADYFDPQANLVRKYLLLFFTQDGSLEMHDLKTKRVFLKRCVCPTVAQRDLFLGGSVTVFCRLLTLVDYGDEATRRLFVAQCDEVFALIHSDVLLHFGNVIHELEHATLRVVNVRLCEFAPAAAHELGVSPKCVAVLVSGENASQHCAKIQEKYSSGVTCFDNVTDIEMLKDIAFKSQCSTATMANCAICVIKPHAITSGHAGDIVQRILDEGFEITALGQFTLRVADAEDFLEVYNGVVPEYKKLVDHLAAGVCWALEVRAENAVAALRALCGPHDPEVCRVLFPNTIRAKFGSDRVMNAVHCTDLAEDGPLESEFFFTLLWGK